MLTLVANSRGLELESREVRAARVGYRRSIYPVCDSQEVDCGGCDDVLQAGFGKTPITCAAQSAAPDSLSVGAFDAGSRCVGLTEFLRCLSQSHLLEGFMMFAALETNEAGFSL